MRESIEQWTFGIVQSVVLAYDRPDVTEKIIGWTIFTGAAMGFLISLYRVCVGNRDFGRWQGSGRVTFIGVCSMWAFAASVGVLVATREHLWSVSVLVAWLVAYLSQNHANRRYERELEELRQRNAIDHPGIFDSEPPVDLEAVFGEELDLYDANTCTFLGTVAKTDLRLVAEVATGSSEDIQNDLYVIYERLGDERLSDGFVRMLEEAIKDRDCLVLRWMPKPQ